MCTFFFARKCIYISDLQFSIGTGAVKAKMYVQIVQPIFGGFMFSLSLSLRFGRPYISCTVSANCFEGEDVSLLLLFFFYTQPSNT